VFGTLQQDMFLTPYNKRVFSAPYNTSSFAHLTVICVFSTLQLVYFFVSRESSTLQQSSGAQHLTNTIANKAPYKTEIQHLTKQQLDTLQTKQQLDTLQNNNSTPYKTITQHLTDVKVSLILNRNIIHNYILITATY
jgi:hypothetical protein